MRRSTDRRAVAAQSPRRGFTMVELLVALAVAGLVVLAAYGVVGFAADASRRLREGRRDALTGLNARATLQGWLRGATPTDGAGPFLGVHRGAAERPLDEVTFGVADAGVHYPGPHRIRLWVSHGPDAARRGLAAEITPVRNGVPGDPDTLMVARGPVVGLRLRYQTLVHRREVWVDEWSSERVLPLAVELRVVEGAGAAALASSRGEGVPALLRLPLRVRLHRGAE